LDIGLAQATAENCLKNKAATQSLLRVIKAAGVTACDKKTGSLLYAVATRATVALERHQEMLGALVGKGLIAHASQLDWVLAYLKGLEDRAQEFHLEAFNKSCGIGVVLTPEQVSAEIRTALQPELPGLKEHRYAFNRVDLMNKAKASIPFVDGKLFNDQFSAFILEQLGPETEEDKKGRKGKKEEKGVKDIEDLAPREMAEAKNTKESLALRTAEFGEGVLTRFPPEPNGFLHIGHAKAIRFNFEIARKHGGKCYLRFDDTNPDREGMDFINMIKENVAYMGYQPWKITYSSDYFDEIYRLTERMIEMGHAFVCSESQETQREKRRLGEPSAFRDRPAEENLRLFREMRDGKFKEGEVCLRGRIDFKHANTTMRDPVIYRIKKKEHPKTGSKWCIYPMYDYTHPICDSLEGISHSLCTLEF
jgi:glutaminyl-tRNA synthetase